MPRVNFREVQNLFFGHVDAMGAGYKIVSEEEDSYYSARFYPFWLHPLYRRGEYLRADFPAEAEVVFTVHPINLIRAQVEKPSMVTEWYFTEDDPLLWPFENVGQMYINAPVSAEQAQQICRFVEARDKRLLQKYGLLSLLLGRGQNPPFASGALPRPLYLAVRDALNELGIAWYGTRDVLTKTLPVLFYADADYIIADDFEVEFPDITHDPAWIQSKEYKGALSSFEP